ncbi:MAG: Pyruvate/2-oxoglutarate dehydrogenase [Acidobacteria bacterium]|nr:Pyruvate/2-oxoglutarate dehydrogenase [Acidobacteriota bacterium]
MSIKVIMPQVGESILEGTLTKWLRKAGERVVRDEPLFEISTDKVDSEIPSPATGTLSEILIPEGQTIQVGAVLATIDESGTGDVPPAPVIEAVEPVVERLKEATVSEPGPPDAERPGTADVRTSPLVRRIAREQGIDLSNVRGTGLSGRITKADILAHTRPVEKPLPAAPQVIAPAPPAAVPQFLGETEIVPMTPMRKAIAEHMILSRRTSAHVQTIFEVDMTSIVQLREKHKQEFETRTGIRLSYTAFFVRALVDTVREFPILNCSVSGDQIIFKKPVNVGVAVALETGLIVPVIRDAHLKSFTDLALAVHDLADRARTKRLKPEEVQQGTISITNPGIYGSLFGTPIIRQPQVAILGVGSLEKRPVIVNDAIAIRTLVYLVLSFDHRVIDGAVADLAMASLKSRLQDWDTWVE